MIDFYQYNDKINTEIFPQGKLFRISFDSSVRKMRLQCFNSNDLDIIRNLFSDVNPAAFFMKQYGYSVPQRLYAINQFGYFEAGLLYDVLSYIKQNYGSYNVLAISENCKKYILDYLTPLKKYLTENQFEISNISDDTGRNEERRNKGEVEYKFRDYQENAIKNMIFLGYGRGIISHATASGKSFTICNLCYNLEKHINKDYKFLILVPNKQLVSQMYNDFIDYGYPKEKIVKFTAGMKKNEQINEHTQVIVSNRQYLQLHKKELPNIDVLFCDECHTCYEAENTRNLILNIPCAIKFGCSGSIPKGKYGQMMLKGIFGKILHKNDIIDLQKRGFVSKMKLYQINIKDMTVENDRNYLFHLHPNKRYSPDENGYSEIPFNAAHDAEHEYYEKYYRELYKPALEYISKFDENTLILFDRIEFGKRLTDMASDIFKGKKIHYIDGSIKVNDRLEIVKEMESNGNNVLFAEFATFQVGINVKRLTNLVFVSSSKSFPRLLQSVGRTLRLHETKSTARIFDINFNFKYSHKHLLERLEIYKDVYQKVPDEKINIEI